MNPPISAQVGDARVYSFTNLRRIPPPPTRSSPENMDLAQVIPGDHPRLFGDDFAFLSAPKIRDALLLSQ